MFIIIVGGGKVGNYLAIDLLSSGQEISLIEKNKEKCNQISEILGSFVIQGDGCDPSVLQLSGIERADIIVAITGDDEDNLIICQIAKNKFNVPFTIARANNPKNEEIFKQLGIDATVSSTNIILSMIEQEVAYKGIMTSLGIKKGGIEIVETLITKESPALNRTLKELNTPSDCLIAGVIRNDNWLIPDGNTVIQVNDMLITLIKKEKFNALKNILMG